MLKKFLLAATMALAALSAFATTYVADDGHGNSVLAYTDQPCSPKVLALLAKDAPADQLHRAKARIEGKDYEACWAQVEDKVIVIYDDGDYGVLPSHLFHAVKDA
jgi:hypothetical protein